MTQFFRHRTNVIKLDEEEDQEDVPLSTLKLKNNQRNTNWHVNTKKDVAAAKKDKQQQDHSTKKDNKKDNNNPTSLLNLALEPDELKNAVESLHSETDNEANCQTMEKIVQMVVDDEIDEEVIPQLVTSLSNVLMPQLTAEIFPEDNLNEETLADSISTPIFVMFRNQFQLSKEEDNRRKLLARLLAGMHSVQPRIGYLLLYFLKVWGAEEEKRDSEPW